MPHTKATEQPEPDASRSGARPSWRRWLLPIGVAVVCAAALGRFLFYEPEPGPAPPRAEPTAQAVVASLETRVEERPDDGSAWQELGVAYSRRGTQTGDVTYYALAGEAFDRVDAIDKDHPATLIGRGELALMLHDFETALRLGRDAHASLPAAAAPLGIIVDAEVEIGSYDAATESLQLMLDRQPGLAALARTSYLRELHGYLPSALEAMERAESAGSGSFEVATIAALVGDLEFRSDDLAAAETAYERALALEPGLIGGVVGRARVLAASGEVSEAIDQLEELVDRLPETGAVVLLGHLQEREGRTADAAESYELVRAIAQLQQAAGQDVDLEMAQFEADVADDPQGAVELARRVHERRPDNVYAADVLAWALHRNQQSGEAVVHIEDARRLDTADPMLYVHAASIFDAVGEPERAREELEGAFEYRPSPSYRYAEEARDLAVRLEVDLPPAWES